eukprot:GHVS01069250.1.p1 GENE.GHVS01069250.1~~GHVS01069250.1.p1  ORF type:complete len:130 (+),score=19.90 GHVS01069250.1:248-637(+)
MVATRSVYMLLVGFCLVAVLLMPSAVTARRCCNTCIPGYLECFAKCQRGGDCDLCKEAAKEIYELSCINFCTEPADGPVPLSLPACTKRRQCMLAAGKLCEENLCREFGCQSLSLSACMGGVATNCGVS